MFNLCAKSEKQMIKTSRNLVFFVNLVLFFVLDTFRLLLLIRIPDAYSNGYHNFTHSAAINISPQFKAIYDGILYSISIGQQRCFILRMLLGI